MIRPQTVALSTGAIFLTTCLAINPSWSGAAEHNALALERMKKDLNFLAGPECEGRGVETEGINKAADYIAETFKELGLKPGNSGGSYFQDFTVSGSAKLGAPNDLVLRGPEGLELKPMLGKQYNICGLTGKGKAEGKLVFAGFGISSKSYDDYAGIDVKEKIVIVLRQAPGMKDKNSPIPDAQAHAPLSAKISAAEAHKAAGIIFVSDADKAKPDDALMSFEYAQGGSSASIPVVHAKRELINQVLASNNVKIDDLESEIARELKPRSFETKGWTAQMQTSVTRGEHKVKNVIGVLEGNGPSADETVVIGAHYDHLGRGERGSRANGNKAIHFGADDNGSGTTAVLELARRFAAVKDRQGRRLVFILFSGEERGLLGSAYYTRNPLFPLDRTIAMINLDMVGRLREDSKSKKENLEIGGVGSAKSFETLLDDLNRKYDFNIKKTRSGTGPSDHTSFYLKKVPVFFFFTGMHPEYHMPADKPETINFEGMEKVTNMVEELAQKLATEKTRPEYVAVVDKNSSGSGSAGGIPTIRFMPGDYDEDQMNGVLVGGVAPAGPAEKGGLKEGDWIVEIAGQPVRNMAGYMKVMSGQKGGEALKFIVKRGEQKVALEITPIPPTPAKQ